MKSKKNKNKVVSNNTKHLEAKMELTDLSENVSQISEKGYDLRIDRIYYLVFTSNFKFYTIL